MGLKGALNGLDKIRKKVEEKTSFDGESPFLKLSDGDAYKIRFLQELSEDADNYDARRGTIAVVEEHANPKNFRLRAVCTMEEEGHCWACDQTGLPEIGKKWRPRMRFYSNVLVRGEKGAEDRIKILAQGFGDKAVGQSLLEMAEEYGSLCGSDAKIKRSGSNMNDTSYTFTPLPPKPLTKDESAKELLDLSKFIKYVSFDDQPAFYAGEDNSDGGDKDSWTS